MIRMRKNFVFHTAELSKLTITVKIDNFLSNFAFYVFVFNGFVLDRGFESKENCQNLQFCFSFDVFFCQKLLHFCFLTKYFLNKYRIFYLVLPCLFQKTLFFFPMKKSYFVFYFQKPYRTFEWNNFQKSDFGSIFVFSQTYDPLSVIFFKNQIRKKNLEIDFKKCFRSKFVSSILLYFFNELFFEKFQIFLKFFSQVLSYQMVKIYQNPLFFFISENQCSMVRQRNLFLRTNIFLNISTYVKSSLEIVFFQNFEKFSQKKKKFSFFHFFKLSSHKFTKRNFFPNWMQISICQLHKIFSHCAGLRPSQKLWFLLYFFDFFRRNKAKTKVLRLAQVKISGFDFFSSKKNLVFQTNQNLWFCKKKNISNFFSIQNTSFFEMDRVQKKRKIADKTMLFNWNKKKEFEIVFNSNNEKWKKYRETNFLFEKTNTQKNLFITKKGFFEQKIVHICFQFFLEKYQYFYFSKNLKSCKNKSQIFENSESFLLKMHPSLNFVKKKNQRTIFKMNYWFFQFFFVWNFFSRNSNFFPYMFIQKNFGKNFFSYSKLDKKDISSKIFKKLSWFNNKNSMLQKQFNNNKNILIFMVRQQFLKNSKKIISRILFFQFSKNPEFFEQNFSMVSNESLLLGRSSIQKIDFENLLQKTNKSFCLSVEFPFFPKKFFLKNSCFDKIFNLFVFNFHNNISDRFYEIQMFLNFPQIQSFWNKIDMSYQNRNEKQIFENWNPTNQCYVSNNIFWQISNFEIFQMLNVFDFSYSNFFLEAELSLKPSVFQKTFFPLFASKQNLFFFEKKQKKNCSKNKNLHKMFLGGHPNQNFEFVKKIFFSIPFLENIHDKIFCHFQKFLIFQKIPLALPKSKPSVLQQILKMKYSSICFVSVSFFDIFLFSDCFWKNRVKPFLLQFVFLYFFQNFLFKNLTFAYLHQSINSSRFFLKFFKDSFFFKNLLVFNIFSKNLLFWFQQKMYWFRPKHFSFLFFNRNLCFQKFQWLFPNNCIFLSPSIENTNFSTISAFSVLHLSFNFFSFFFLKPFPSQNLQFFLPFYQKKIVCQAQVKISYFPFFSRKKKENFFVNDKTNQLQIFPKFQKTVPFFTLRTCSVWESNAKQKFRFDIRRKCVSKKVSGFQFSDFFVFVYFKHEKSVQPVLFIQKKPTWKSISIHINECQRILQNSIGQTQLTFMKKLQKKIFVWCISHKSSSTHKIFHLCDAILMKYLWNWAKKSHPTKSKYWIRQRYFHLTFQKKWLFGKKIGNQFICLQPHSQFSFP